MKLVFTSLCVAAVVFMLRFLVAILRGRLAWQQPQSVYFAKFNPAKQRGELIVMNSKSYTKDPQSRRQAGSLHRSSRNAVDTPLHGQHAPNDVPASASVSPNPKASAPQTEQEIVQELAAMKKRIEQLETALKQHEAAEQPTTVVHSAKASAPVGISPNAEFEYRCSRGQAMLPQTNAAPAKPAKSGAVCLLRTGLGSTATAQQRTLRSIQNSSLRKSEPTWTTSYDLNHPKDNTIGGSSEVFRSNEVQLDSTRRRRRFPL